MLKRLFYTLALLFFTYCSYAQFDTTFIKTNIRQCADSLATGFRTKNWELFTRYSYPAMIGSMGGKKEFMKYVSTTFSKVPDSAWKRYEPGKILQVIKTGKDLQAVIELHSALEWQESLIVSTTYLIAESWDGGLFWTFFDSQGDARSARAIKPDLSDLLNIPAKQEKLEPLMKPGKKNTPGKHQQ